MLWPILLSNNCVAKDVLTTGRRAGNFWDVLSIGRLVSIGSLANGWSVIVQTWSNSEFETVSSCQLCTPAKELQEHQVLRTKHSLGTHYFEVSLSFWFDDPILVINAAIVKHANIMIMCSTVYILKPYCIQPFPLRKAHAPIDTKPAVITT